MHKRVHFIFTKIDEISPKIVMRLFRKLFFNFHPSFLDLFFGGLENRHIFLKLETMQVTCSYMSGQKDTDLV